MWYAPEFNKVFSTHSDIRSFYVGGENVPFIIFPKNIPDDLEFCGLFPLRSALPQVESGQVTEPAAVEMIDGEWTQLWTVRDMTPEEVEASRPPVPQEVTMRQARLALLAIGKLDEVPPAIEGLSGADRDVARIEWEFSSTVVRSRALVVMLGQALGLDDEALDQLFVTAATL